MIKLQSAYSYSRALKLHNKVCFCIIGLKGDVVESYVVEIHVMSMEKPGLGL